MTVLSVASEPATAVGPPAGAVQPRTLAGFGPVLRMMARRDRLRMAIWLAAIIAVVVLGSSSVIGLYDTPEDLEQYARIAQADAAVKAMAGPGYGLDAPTLGAVVMNEVALFTFVGVALYAVFMVVRHTRDEEESGRAELVRAAPVGRHAALCASIVWVGGGAVLLGAAIAVGLIALALPVAGSVAFGAACALTGLFFVGATATVAQVVTTARLARGVTSAVLLVAFLLRAVGDMGNGVLSWLSPLGWSFGVRAYAGERWWVLGGLFLGAVALAWASVALSARRDLGHGFVEPAPGPTRGAPRLATPLAMAVRLQRWSLLGWVVGVGAMATMMGLIADQADELMSNDAMAEMFEQMGGTPTESFLATAVLSAGLIASGFAVSSVLYLRSEEVGLRAAPVLAGPVARRRWLLSHVSVALVGGAGILLLAGLVAGAGYAGKTGDGDGVPTMLAASAAMVPALWVMSALTVLLFAIGPRAALFSWAAVAYAALSGFLADVFDLPAPVRGLSPFEHVPSMPAESFAVLPVLALTVVAIAMIAAAVLVFDRRAVHGG